MDVTGAERMADLFRSALEDRDIILISAVTGKGVKALLSRLAQMIDQEGP